MQALSQSTTVAINLDAGSGAVPDWVHLLPVGRIDGRDGRSFVLDNPEQVIAAFAAGGRDLAVD